MKYAIIDIGSNSVRLMLWASGKTLYKKVKTTRLGEGLAAFGRLQLPAMERTLRAVGEFVGEGRGSDAEIHVFATAAVRSSLNGQDFCREVSRLFGVDVDVVSGRDEALLAMLGALGKRDGGIIDIGGASTEICLKKCGELVFTRSLDIGAVRLHDECGEDMDKLLSRIRSTLAELPVAASDTVYAVGGTASTLASLKLELEGYDPALLQETALPRKWVRDTSERLFALPLEERRLLKGMDAARADILGGATLLLEQIMERMGISEVKFSDRDNLEGYLALKGLK